MISSFDNLSLIKPPAFSGRFSLGENMYKSRFNYENTTNTNNSIKIKHSVNVTFKSDEDVQIRLK